MLDPLRTDFDFPAHPYAHAYRKWVELVDLSIRKGL